MTVDVSAASADAAGLNPQQVKALVKAVANVEVQQLLLPSISGTENDSVSASLLELASSPMLALLQAVDDRLSQGLSQVAGQQAAPAHASPGVIALDARDFAEKIVAKAAHAIELGGIRGHQIPANLDPPNVLAVANQFIETGQVPNYLRAAELASLVASWYERPLPAIGPAARAGRHRQLSAGFRLRDVARQAWRRTPLLCLLFGWLVPGVAAGLFLRITNGPAYTTVLLLEIWGLGLLALVGLQFVITVRGALRRKNS